MHNQSTWQHTQEHTMEANLMNVMFVRQDLDKLPTLKTIKGHTLETNHMNVMFVRRDLSIHAPW